MIYLDNSATSFPKPKQVINTVKKSVNLYCGNAGRSGHNLSVRTAERIFKTRETISEHLGFDSPERIVFTQNATHALNFAIKGVVTSPCHIIISNLEHNSVLRPIVSLNEKLGVEYSSFDAYGDIKNEIARLIQPNTKFIVCTIVSNVTGKEIDLLTVSDIAKELGLGLILDVSQYIGHKRIDLSGVHFSALCAPGHKGLFGIMGSGFVVFGKNATPVPILDGGSGYDSLNAHMPSDLPERMEAGTLSSVAISSLCEGIKFIESYGVECIDHKLKYLCEYARKRLSEIDNCTVYGAENGIVSFNIDGKSSNEVAEVLNKHNIYVRGGLHCAPLSHKYYGTLASGMVRASFSLFNKISDVDRMCKVLCDEYNNSRR